MLEEEVRDLASSIGPIAIRRRSSLTNNVHSTLQRRRRIARSSALLVIDCFVVAAAVAFTANIAYRLPGLLVPAIRSSSFLIDLAVPLCAIVLYLALSGRYTARIPFWTETRFVTSAAFFAAGMEVAVGVLAGDIVAPLTSVFAIVLGCCFAVAANYAAKITFYHLGIWQLSAVVIGSKTCAANLEAALSADKSMGYRVTARVDPSILAVAAGSMHLSSILPRHDAQCLLIAVDDAHTQRNLVETALREQVPFATVVLPGFRCHVTRMLGHEAMLLSHASGLRRPFARLLKVAFDVAVASLILLVAAPVLAIIAILVRSDGGTVLFRHRRLGAGGQHFWCFKFRTMVMDAEQVLEDVLTSDPVRAAEWRATQKLQNDPRVTRIGRFLRSTSLDELPQLINVLRLDMSLVGPRPIVDNEIEFYGADVAHYFATRPGITGLWQVSGRSDTSYPQRVRLDVWYVTNWTIWCDIAVLLKTIPVVLQRRGAR